MTTEPAEGAARLRGSRADRLVQARCRSARPSPGAVEGDLAQQALALFPAPHAEASTRPWLGPVRTNTGVLAVQLVVMGFVTAEAVVRLWADGTSSEWWVEEADDLRGMLGVGRVDREPMVPDAQTEMGLLVEAESALGLAAPFAAGETPMLVAPPFAMARVQVTPTTPGVPALGWSSATSEAFVTWAATSIAARGPQGEELVIHERDARGRGRRVVSTGFDAREGGLMSIVATNSAPPRGRLWDQARTSDGGAVLSAPVTGESPMNAATLVLEVLRSWPGGPLDLVCAWDQVTEPW